MTVTELQTMNHPVCWRTNVDCGSIFIMPRATVWRTQRPWSSHENRGLNETRPRTAPALRQPHEFSESKSGRGRSDDVAAAVCLGFMHRRRPNVHLGLFQRKRL